MTELEQKALMLVRRGQCRSRAELSRALQISRPTASSVVEKLLKKQALCESGYGKIPRGKFPMLLEPVSGYQYTIGLDLGYTRQLVGILLDGKNQIIRKAETGFDSSSRESIRAQAGEVIRRLSADYSVSGIGIALSGIVAPETGRVLKSINPLFTESDIGALFSGWTNLPVMVENRSRAAAFSEAYGGAADRQNNFLLCSLGKSIGAAFWLNGKVFPGAYGGAGEIRCLRLADGRTFEEALSLENVSGYPEEKLVSLCAEGLYQLTQIMDLDLLVLTGRFTDFGPEFLEKLTGKLSVTRKCKVVFSDYGRFSAARGAAEKMAEKLLERDCPKEFQ